VTTNAPHENVERVVKASRVFQDIRIVLKEMFGAIHGGERKD
jgi:hypothetical protein